MTFGRVVAAIVAVGLAAHTAARRRSASWWRIAGVALVVLALGAYAAGLTPTLPDPKTVLEGLSSTLGPYAYLLVGSVCFLETGAFLGLLTPGEFVVLLGGVVAGRGEIDIVVLVGITWFASLAGDSTGYWLGRRLGRGFLERRGPRFRITESRLSRAEAFFERRGGTTIVAGRFVGFMRPLIPFIAGSTGMPYRRFLPYSVVGTGLWAPTLSLLGWFFYSSFARVADLAGQASAALGGAIAVIAAGVLAWRKLRHPEQREHLRGWLEKQGDRPALRPLARLWTRALAPLGRRAAGPVRFLFARLTPGGLGIELTSAVAVAGVGFYVFVLYASIIGTNPGALTPLDRLGVGILRTLPLHLGLPLTRAFTWLASIQVTAAVALVGAVWLLVRRRRAEAAALLVCFGAVWAAVQMAKAGVDRPRPPVALSTSDGSSYPSGHAAYATTYVALALAAARALPGFKRLAALVGVAIVLAAALGLTRMLVNVHYFSDVAGGWGLGFGVYALGAVAVLVHGYLRRDGAPDPAAAAGEATVEGSRG